MVFAIPPSPYPAGPKSQEHGPNKLPKAGSIHGVLSTLAAVLEVMGVEGGAWQGDALRRLVVCNQPLDGGRADAGCIAQLVTRAHLTATQARAVWRLLASHGSDQRGAGAVRRRLNKEGGTGVGDQLGLGCAQPVGRGGVEAGVEGCVEGGGGGGDGGVEGRGHIDCTWCIGGAGKLTRVHILQYIQQSVRDQETEPLHCTEFKNGILLIGQ